MGKLKFGVAVCAMGAAFAAGCGDDEESSDGEQTDPTAAFVAEVSDLCVDEAVEQRETIQGNFPVTDEAAAAAQVEELRESFNGLTNDFEGIEAPEELAATYDGFLASREAIDEARVALTAANESGNTDKIAAADENLQATGEERAQIAKELGLTACTRELPADQQEAATAVLEELTVSTDPERVCDELVYEEYLEGSFPGDDPYQRCADFQQKLIDQDQEATGIEVTRVTGTDGVGTTIEYSDVGGKFDGLPTKGTLYYEDGVWKVWELVGL